MLVAGAERGRLRRLRHGLECIARVPRPQAQSAGAGAGRHRLDRRRHDAAAVEASTLRMIDRRRHRRDLCGADRHRIVDRAAQRLAEALAGDRGAGHARFRADAADPARQPAAARTTPFAASVWVTVFAVELVLYAIGTVFVIFMLVSERAVTAHKTAASMDPLTGMFNRRGFAEACVAGDRARSQCRPSGDGADLRHRPFQVDQRPLRSSRGRRDSQTVLPSS